MGMSGSRGCAFHRGGEWGAAAAGHGCPCCSRRHSAHRLPVRRLTLIHDWDGKVVLQTLSHARYGILEQYGCIPKSRLCRESRRLIDL